MKLFLAAMPVLILLSACSTKNPPTRDISNAKMALVKAESEEVKRYASDDLVRIKMKYQNLQKLMHEKRYEEAKYLAQEIQADARFLQMKSQRIMMEKRVKKLEGDIHRITKDFIQIKE